jgi:hypothetical protein
MPRFRYAAAVAIGVLLMTACATVPTPQINDLKSVAGRWQGNGGSRIKGFPARGSVELTIREDGTGEFFWLPETLSYLAPRLAGVSTTSPARFSVKDGKLLYETAEFTGTAILRERMAREPLKVNRC